jgi:hypothetical protein
MEILPWSGRVDGQTGYLPLWPMRDAEKENGKSALSFRQLLANPDDKAKYVIV